jgi:hypothetical protein
MGKGAGDMPSIPQSLLWISLVVLWLFVLVPMLISKRDAVRRTSDVALATRVLNGGKAAHLLRRKRPAAGHHSDPDWQPSAEDSDELDDDLDREPERSVVVAAAVAETEEPDYLDVDIVEEDSGALPVGASAAEEVQDVQDVAEPVAEPEPARELDDPEDLVEVDTPEVRDEAPEPDGTADEYEYVADSSGLEAPSDTDLHLAESMSAARRRRYESKTAAAVSARKYKFRKRMVSLLMLALVASAAAAFLLAPSAWWVCGSVGAITLLYLAYLRRQTRIEERLRRRRAQRMARSRLGVENTGDRELDVVPSRLRRPGAAVLEIDDEDPVFEHLDDAPSARDFDLPRAAGQ